MYYVNTVWQVDNSIYYPDSAAIITYPNSTTTYYPTEIQWKSPEWNIFRNDQPMNFKLFFDHWMLIHRFSGAFNVYNAKSSTSSNYIYCTSTSV